MALGIEHEPANKIPEGIKERPTDVDIPENIEHKEGIQARPSQFTAQVSQGGQQLISSPATQQITIQLPDEPEKLESLAKGKPSEASTWFGRFWLRVIKMARFFGWKVIEKN